MRKAISAGFSRATVAQQAEQGYEAPATSSSGLLLPNFASVLPAAQANDLKPDADAATVTSLDDGCWLREGQQGHLGQGRQGSVLRHRRPDRVHRLLPGGQIMSSELKAVGFNATPDGVDANKWYADLAAGTFDTAIHWSTTGPSPYATYDSWLDPASPRAATVVVTTATSRTPTQPPHSRRTPRPARRKMHRTPSTHCRRSCPTRFLTHRSCTPPVGTNTTRRTTAVGSTRTTSMLTRRRTRSNVEYVILHLTPNS